MHFMREALHRLLQEDGKREPKSFTWFILIGCPNLAQYLKITELTRCQCVTTWQINRVSPMDNNEKHKTIIS